MCRYVKYHFLYYLLDVHIYLPSYKLPFYLLITDKSIKVKKLPKITLLVVKFKYIDFSN